MKLKFAKYYLILFILLISHKGFSQDLLNFPLITLQANNMVKSDFYSLMSYLSEDPNEDFGSFSASGSFMGPVALSVGISYLKFKSINDWFSLPFFGSGSISGVGNSAFGGTGIILKNRFLKIGLMGGLYYNNFSKYDNDSKVFYNDDTKYDFGLFPVLNTKEYPILSFLEKIDGFLYSDEKEVTDARIQTLNYLLNISFKPIFGLSVLEIYTRKNKNDFMYGFDLSNIKMRILNTSYWESAQKANPLGSRYEVHTGSDPDANIFKTTIYGLRIGKEHFVVDLNYLTIDDGLKVYIDDIQGYKDYDFPFGLNGFPSVVLNFITEDNDDGLSGWYMRFSTLTYLGMPYIPEIGITFRSNKNSYFISWTAPITINFSYRIIF